MAKPDNQMTARAGWQRLQYAFAGFLHAIADNIESRVELAVAKQKLKEVPHAE